MSVTTEPTDPELLDRMAGGDREALAIIFRRHHATVYRFSRQMLGSIEAAEDVTQDVFVALTKAAGRFDPAVASLSTYLYGIARNLVLQRYKRSRARIEVNIDAIAGQDEARIRDFERPGRDNRARAGLARAAAGDPAAAGPLSGGRRALRAERPFVRRCGGDSRVPCRHCPVAAEPGPADADRAMQAAAGARCRGREHEQRAEGKGQRAGEGRAKDEGRGKRWLIPTKNNC